MGRTTDQLHYFFLAFVNKVDVFVATHIIQQPNTSAQIDEKPANNDGAQVALFAAHVGR